MKTIDEILYQKVSTTLVPSRQLVNIKLAMKEYAIEVLDHLMSNSEEYIYIDVGEEYMNDEHTALFKYEAIEKLKRELK